MTTCIWFEIENVVSLHFESVFNWIQYRLDDRSGRLILFCYHFPVLPHSLCKKSERSFLISRLGNTDLVRTFKTPTNNNDSWL